MPDDRSLLEREMHGVEVRPFTLADFHRRRQVKQRNRRLGTTLAVVVFGALALAGSLRAFGDEPEQETITTPDAGMRVPTPFEGKWEATDNDGSSETMEIRYLDGGELRAVIRDDAANVCSGAPSTMTGVGLTQPNGRFVIPDALLSCDDGSSPALANGDQVGEHVTDVNYVHDPITDELVDDFDVVWRRSRDGSQPVSEATDVLSVPGVTTGFPLLEAGTYFIDPDGDPSTTLRVEYDVPDGWSAWIGAAKFYEDTPVEVGDQLGVTITTVTNLVEHGCKNHSLAIPEVGPTVDDLATALTELKPFVLSSPPRPTTLAGYSGQHLEWKVPDDIGVVGGEFDCDAGNLMSFDMPLNGGPFFGYNAEPGRTEELWILDVDGTRLLVAAQWSPASSKADIAEMRAIVDSIRVAET